MSELKVHKAYNRWLDEEMPTPNDDLICNEFYLKSEADKVIAELEESHKKEVGQLLMEIAELKEERRWRKFSEEKPNDKQVVLVHGDNWFETAFYHDDGSIDFGDDIHFSNIIETPYWMPLPSVPKEKA